MSKFVPANDDQDDEEWKAAHKDDPVERVREPVDNRSLFEKLQEQKAAKEDAYNEATKFSNLIRRLDNDEIDFLASVREQKQKEEERKKRNQDAAIDRFRTAQRMLDAEATRPRPGSAVVAAVTVKSDAEAGESRKRRKPNLTGIVKRAKSVAETVDTAEKRETGETEQADRGTAMNAAKVSTLVSYDSDSD